jgi:hypothetical protein
MNRLNPIVEDYKLFVVFKNIGLQLLQQLRMQMSMPPYSNFFRDVAITEQNELLFSYLQQHFKTGIELFFNHSRMPKSALLATYWLRSDRTAKNEEIISYSFDLNYQINDIYALADFAEHYLIEFHQNLKKSFSEHHIPFAIRMK